MGPLDRFSRKQFSFLTVSLIMLMGLPACGDSPSLPMGKGTDLHTTLQMAWESSHEPLIATSAEGKVYVIWLGKCAEKPDQDAAIPFIPNDFTFATARPDWASVPGISVFDGKAWSKPQLLVAGIRECDPLYAWCTGEDLNLLVSSDDADTFYHLQYHPKDQTWTRLHTVPGGSSNYSAYLLVGNVLHVGVSSDSLSYLRYDGKEWSKPLAIDGTISTSRPHLAATSDGTVHLLWRAPSGGAFGHLAVSASGTPQKSTVTFPILRDEFDVATDPDGNLLVAYQADLPKGHPDADAVHVRTFQDGKWSEPTLIGKFSGLMLGDIRTAYFNGQAFLTWVHRADYSTGSMHVSGPVRSYVILDKKGWSDPKPVATTPDELMGGGFMGEPFIGLHIDQLGRVHVAWSSGPFNYHAVSAHLNTERPATASGPAK